jgi:S1-C subfamily serine protease
MSGLWRCFVLGLLVLLCACGSLAGEGDPPGIAADELAAVKLAEAARVRAIESVYGSVVAIYGNDRQGGGSGVLFDAAGYALTNHHVVAAAGKEGWAGLADGKLYRWKLVGTDPGGDVAIIQLQGQAAFPAARLGNSDNVRVGEWAMAMGNPFVLAEDQRPTVTLGIVSGVKRYQEGAGMNQLVYGNCIQVDSSINPGNSGGPLFNLRGEVVGINGRGSFEERGRVNVGLGYAISSNQVKTFVPELLAAKIAQHGTLDAVFGNRADGVICYTLNLDSPIAKAGLELGDKLIAFEGVPIDDANQFTNLITCYPAGWPAEVTFEHAGEQRTVHVRLTALPYEPIARPMTKPPEKPEDKPVEKPEEKTPAEEKPLDQPDEKPGEPPMPKIEIKPMPPSIPLGNAGKILDNRLNESVAREILSRWRANQASQQGQAVAGLRLESEIRRGEEVVGTQMLIVARDGRLRAEYEIDGKSSMVVFDGKQYWDDTPGLDPRTIARGKAILDPHFAQAMAIGALLTEQTLPGWEEIALDGSDKAASRLCYRISATDESSEQLFLWLSVFDDRGQPRIELVKTGVGLDDDEPIAGTLYSDFRAVDSFQIPHKRRLTRGLAEEILLEIATTHCEALSETPDELFAMPE